MSELIQNNVGCKTKFSHFCVLSHFPELHAALPLLKTNKVITDKNTPPSIPIPTPVGVLLLKPELFKKWWEEDFTCGLKIVSPENPFGPSVKMHFGMSFIPRREIFRHLDGYSHVGIANQIYKVLPPTIRVKKIDNEIKIVNEPWNISTNYLEMNNLQNFDLMHSSPTNSKTDNFKILLIKISSRRFSYSSSVWAGTLYGHRESQTMNEIFKFFKEDGNFRKMFLRSLYEWPLILIYRWSVLPFFRHFFKKYIAQVDFLTFSASSIGLTKFPFLLLVEIFEKRLKRLLKVFSQISW